MIIPGIMAQRRAAGGGMPDAYPEIRAITQNTSGSGAHTNAITAAGNSEIGDRLILLVAVTGTGAISPPSTGGSWSLLLGGGTSGIGTHVFYTTKTADAASATITIPGSRSASSIAISIKAGTFDASSPPIASTVTTAFSSTTPNPPLATDGAGVGKQLVLAFVGHSVPTGVTTYPLPDSQTLNASTCSAILCAIDAEVSSYDPANFVLGTSGTNQSVTILNRAPP